MNIFEIYNHFLSEAEFKDLEFSKDERKAFLESLRNFSRYAEIIRSRENLIDAVNEVIKLAEMADQVMLKETDGWFDKVTVNRHSKQLKEALKILQKEAEEIAIREQRLQAAFEDIGTILSKYYEL